jgi:hypothetical protein
MVRKFFFNRSPRPTPPPSEPPFQQINVGSLAQSLQQILQEQVAQPNRLQIRCAVRDGVLLILVEHLLHVEPDPPKTFTVLEHIVTDRSPSLMVSDPECSPTAYARPLPARIYIRVAGYQQPYAFHSFTIEPRSPLSTTATHNTLNTNIALADAESKPSYDPLLLEPEQPPEVSEPEVSEPEVSEPEVSEPEVSELQPEPEIKPEVSELEIAPALAPHPPQAEESSEPEVATGEADAVSELDAAEPDVAGFVTTEPDVAQPEVAELAVAKEITELETESEAAESEIVESKAELEIAESEIAESEVIELEISASEIMESADTRSQAEPEGAAPESVELEIAKSEIVESEIAELAAQLEVAELEIAESEISELEVIETEFAALETEPELAEPELPEPEVIESEVIHSEIAELKGTEPKAAQSEVVKPEVAQPEVAQSEIVDLEVAQLETTRSAVAELEEVAQPDAELDTEPAAVELEVAEPEVAQPEVTRSEAPETTRSAVAEFEAVELETEPEAEPEVAESEFVESEITQLEAIRAEIAQPEDPQPEITELEPELEIVELQGFAPEVTEPDTEPEVTELETAELETEVDRAEDIRSEFAELEEVAELEAEPEVLALEVAAPEIAAPEIAAPETEVSELENADRQVSTSARFDRAMGSSDPFVSDPFVSDPFVSDPFVPNAEVANSDRFVEAISESVDNETLSSEQDAIGPEAEATGSQDEALPDLTAAEATDQGAPPILEYPYNEFLAAEEPIALQNPLELSEFIQPDEQSELDPSELDPSELDPPITFEPVEIQFDQVDTATNEFESFQFENVEVIDHEVIDHEVIDHEVIDHEVIDHEVANHEVVLESEAELQKEPIEQDADSEVEHQESIQELVESNITPVENIPVKPIAQTSTDEQSAHASVPYTTPSVLLIPNADSESSSSLDRLPIEVSNKSRGLRSKVTLLEGLVTGAVGLFVVIGGVYVLTRPCVLGSECQPIQEAQRLSQRASNAIQNNPSALEVVDAYDQLNQAKQLLEPIPFWSRYHGSARTFLAEYNGKLDELGLLVTALNQANTAAKKSLNPPHPVQIWREVQWLWREAINSLEHVPETSPVYALAQNKRNEYETNLESINHRIRIEQETQERVAAVQQASEVINARLSIVASSDNWQQALDSWQTLIANLEEIPQGTMAYSEAQRLIRIYQLNIQETERRRERETQSTDAYQQATNAAEQARLAEQRGQWPQAATYWQEAVTNLRQIQEGTANYSQAQALVDSYTTSFNQAEENAKRSTLLQTATPQLDRACNSSRLCGYTLGTNVIQVQIAPGYDLELQRAFTAAQLNAGNMVQADVSPQLNQLLRSLAAAGETAQVPVELYNAAGSRFGAYDPNRAGYILQ